MLYYSILEIVSAGSRAVLQYTTDSLGWQPCCTIVYYSSLGWQPCCTIVYYSSLGWQPCCTTVYYSSLGWQPCCTIVYYSCLGWQPCCTIVYYSSLGWQPCCTTVYYSSLGWQPCSIYYNILQHIEIDNSSRLRPSEIYYSSILKFVFYKIFFTIIDIHISGLPAPMIFDWRIALSIESRES